MTESPAFPWLAVILAVLILLLVGLLIFLIVRNRRKKKEKKPGWQSLDDLSEAAEDDEPAIERMKDSFENAVSRLKRYVSGRDYRYGIPWFLLIGEQESGKSTALSHVGLNLPLAGPPERKRSDVQWWFFEDGIVLDVPGEFVLARRERGTRDRLWRSLLRLLQRHRRLRPIDGVVLTVPASELVGESRPTPDKLERRADLIYQKLLEAQRMLGFRFPIYVVVTKCDLVPGFQSYAHAVPPNLMEGMLGWSSPYGVEEAYAPRWVDEAVESITASVQRSQLELMHTGLHSMDPDGFFVFPRMLDRLRTPLRHYLDEIFKESAYHESFFLRGIYLAGDQGEHADATPIFTLESGDGQPSAQGQPAALEHTPVFLTDLFSRKVFVEFELAQPLSQVYFWRNRTARIYQIAAVLLLVVWSVGMAFSYDRLDKTRASLAPVLDQIPTNVQSLQHPSLRMHDRAFVEHADRIVSGFTAASSTNFNSVFIPPLWFSDIEDRLVGAFALAFDRIVFRAIRIRLDERAHGAINASYYLPATTGRAGVSPLSGRFGEDIVAVDEQHSFRELQQYVNTLTDLETHAGYYSKLRMTQRPEDLAAVIAYLFRVQMPGRIRSHAHFFQAALASIDIEPFHPDSFQIPADARARVMLAQLYADVFRDNSLRLRLRDLSMKIDALTSLDRRIEEQARTDVSLARQVIDAAGSVELALKSPKLAYLHMRVDTTGAYDRLGVDPAFDRLLASMDSLHFFSDDMIASAQRTAAHALNETRQELLAISSRLTGPLLYVNALGELSLSPDLIAVRDALASVDAQQFATGSYVLPSEVGSGRRLIWDVGLLRQAAALPQQYRQLVADRMSGMPPSLRVSLEHGVSGHLSESIVGLAARAAIFEPASPVTTVQAARRQLQPQVENLAAATPFLMEINTVLMEMGAQHAAAGLKRLILLQAQELLGQLDAVLEHERFYSVSGRQIARWRNDEPIFATLFNTADDKIVDVYLALQWEQVSYLASMLAEPVVTVLDSGARQEDPSGLASKWSALLRQVRNKENKIPDNSVDILEAALRDVMMTTTPESCLARTSEPVVRTALGDYFLVQAASYMRELGARCGEKALDNAIQRYESLAGFFNENLSGRFPFADSTATVAEAPAGAVTRFYGMFDSFVALSRPSLEQAFKRGDLKGSALRFIQQMQDARPLFAASLEEKGFGVPTVDAKIDFRVHRGAEKLGEHIIEWSVTAGGKTVRMGDADRTVRWTFGDPILVDVRLAKDSPYYLLGAPGFPGVVDPPRKLVSYTYRGSWALPQLLQRHRTPEDRFDEGYDPQAHTLMAAATVQRQGAEIERLEGFFRLQMVEPVSGRGFVFNGLPSRAPGLSSGDSRER